MFPSQHGNIPHSPHKAIIRFLMNASPAEYLHIKDCWNSSKARHFVSSRALHGLSGTKLSASHSRPGVRQETGAQQLKTAAQRARKWSNTVEDSTSTATSGGPAVNNGPADNPPPNMTNNKHKAIDLTTPLPPPLPQSQNP
ncbi:hypothetical protein J6590_024929 [Homalodisca vitripennis]|nr:hypothetical protein J6590_024929 [Homalodisca vitripennis]